MSNTVNNYTETDLGNISLNPRGEYDSSAEYEYLDAVSYQGGSYFCLAELETTITGIAPDAGHNSKHWQMIAAPGDMTPEYTAAHNNVIKKAVQVETSRAAVELAQQEIEAVQTDVQQLHSDTVQAAQEAENSKNSAANSAQSAEQSRKIVSESEQNINGQIAGFDSRVSEAVEQSKEEINTTKQQAINTITNQQTTSVNTVKTEGEKIITRVGNDAKTVADDRATVEEATQTVLNNAQEVAQNTQTVASNTENAAASAESAKTSADNAAQSAKSVEDASKQIEQNKKDVDSLKEDLSNKITKFYASNQGETHITDSDNGKIQDMMLYGKSEQKQYIGKNLINSDEYYSKYKQNDGTYKGKASEFNKILVPISKYIGTQITVSCKVTVPLDTTSVLIEATINGAVTKGNRIESGKSGVIALTISPRTESDTIKITYGDGGDGIVVASEFQIEKGSEVTPYEPYVGGQPSPSPNYPQRIKSVVNPTVKVTNEDESKVQSVTLNNIILNAIPVSSGGNVTIDGQQYIADYVDVEREKLVRMVGVADQDTFVTSKWDTGSIIIYSLISNVGSENAIVTISSKFAANWSAGDEIHHFTQPTGQTLVIVLPKTITTVEQGEEIRAKGFKFYYILITPIEIDLTTEEITAFKALATYYPTTNISVNSEQLDGYTVFNYPISMENGWNYVKKQLNDNRDYIYDMDTRTQDMDIQAAEAYVNSEYAVALTELEV